MNNRLLLDSLVKSNRISSKKFFKYLFSDLDFIFTKQRFRLLFLKRKLKIFEYNQKNNQLFYKNTDYIKKYFDNNLVFENLNLGNPITLISDSYGNLSNYRSNIKKNKDDVISYSAQNKLINYSNYFEKLYYNKLIYSIQNSIESDIAYFDNNIGSSIKNIKYIDNN